jgi:hypothetical protein
MAWNDGVSKELSDFFASIDNYSQQAVTAVQEQIDIEVAEFMKQLEQTTPRGATLGLLNSLRQSKITARRNWYGYSVEFEGEDRHGTPFQKIANILNYGTRHIQGTRFISRAIRKLKGMDDRIAERFKNKTK